VSISACKKNSDWASAWVGTYNGTVSGNNVNRVIISGINSTTLQIQLQTTVYGTYYTYTTLQHATLATASSVAVNETDSIAGQTGIWNITGGGSLTGDSLKLSGTATQTGQTTLYYSFNGGK
jgi:hypothetical protein